MTLTNNLTLRWTHAEAGQPGEAVRDGREPRAPHLAGQASAIHGGTRNTHFSMPHNLQEPPRSLSTVHLCQGERGIHGGMQGAVFSSMVVYLVLVVAS